MVRLMRTFLLLPAVIITLVVLPSIAFSKGDFRSALQSTLASTISPLPTPPGSTVPFPTATAGTVPFPTVTPTRQPYPTATPYTLPGTAPTPVVATTSAPAIQTGGALINGVRLRKVIGDRLSSHLYGISGEGWLYRSSDDGRSWLLVTTHPMIDDFIMSAADPDVLYSGTGIPCDGQSHSVALLYKSTDGGVTWSALQGAENLRPLLTDQGNADNVFAAGCDAPYLSTDGGMTWNAKPDNSPEGLWSNYHVTDMAAASLLGNPRPTTPNWGQIFAGGVAEDGSGVIAFTNDQGATWTRLTPNVFPSSWGLSALTVDLFTEGLVIFAEPKSVWQSENYGVNWQITTKGLGNVLDRGLAGAQFGLNDIAYHPTGRLYLASVRGLYTKVFTARNWEKVSDADFEQSNITSLLYTESHPSVLWLNTTDGVFTYSIQ